MNHRNDYPPYFPRPTTHASYVADGNTNPYPPGQLEFDSRSSNRQGYGSGYGEVNASPSSENRELGLDHWPSTLQGYGNRNRFLSPGNRSFGLDHRRSSFQDHNAGIGAPTPYGLFEERLAVRPSSHTGIPTNPPPVPRIPPQVIVIGSHINGTSPRFPFSHTLTSRLSLNQEMINTHTLSGTENESKLTRDEQEQVLKKLKKEVYNPTPAKMMLSRRVSLYYRDLNHDPNNAQEMMDSKNNKKSDEGKRCAVCLEDFGAGEEVMLTPCDHMFHEDCIVPWVQSHGQCPVCRSVFCERIKENGSGNGNRAVALPAGHGLFEDELLSLIQTVNEVFRGEPRI